MLSELQKMIEEITGKQNVIITEKTELMSETGLSSYDLVQLVCAAEDRFNIEISDRAIKNFITVGDVIAYIQKCQNG